MISPQNRLRVLNLFIFSFALILVGKLYYLQIVKGGDFRLKAEHQYVAGINFFDRGSIYFSTKEGTLIPAATVKLGFILSVNPNLLKGQDLESIYERINTITPIDKTNFLAKAKKIGDPYEEVSKRLDQSVADKISALKINGVAVTRERWRSYPGESMAAHTVGLVGFAPNEGDKLSGRYGLERSYEKVLERGGDEVFVNFFAEVFSNIKSAVEDKDVQGDIVTTIEPSAQAFLEGELEKVTKDYASDFTGGIVIDPNSGEILAMALTPTFDPNAPQSAPNSNVFSNKLVEGSYEMGSIIKALTYAIGLDTHAISARTTYNDPGCMTLNKKTFCNYDGVSHGTSVSMQTALSKSLNTGAAFVVSKIGNKRFEDYMLKFGIGEKTGIDLPNEGTSLVSNLRTNRDLELAQASFGQGIALTPIATVRALSALANGGTLITPHLVKEVKYKIGGGRTLAFPPEKDRVRVISPEAAEEISRMLTVNVDQSLREGSMRLENYSVAAKTGTAQIARPGGGGYYEDKYLHSFMGYFPSYNPEFLVFLFTYDPKNVQFASETLTDAFFNMTKFLINYYNVAPDREAPPQAVSL